MRARRGYADACGVARALDLVGERWALLVVRELLYGPKRFTDLSRGLPGMSQNVLAQRLRDLEQSGVVHQRRLGPPTRSRVYELTPTGYALRPALIGLARWGSRQTISATMAELSIDALVLALETTFDPDRAGRLQGRFELRLGDDAFCAAVERGTFSVARIGARAELPTQPGPRDVAGDGLTAVFETDVRTLRGLVFGGRALADALASGDLTLSGDRQAAARFLACFPRPSPFAAQP